MACIDRLFGFSDELLGRLGIVDSECASAIPMLANFHQVPVRIYCSTGLANITLRALKKQYAVMQFFEPSYSLDTRSIDLCPAFCEACKPLPRPRLADPIVRPPHAMHGKLPLLPPSLSALATLPSPPPSPPFHPWPRKPVTCENRRFGFDQSQLDYLLLSDDRCEVVITLFAYFNQMSVRDYCSTKAGAQLEVLSEQLTHLPNGQRYKSPYESGTREIDLCPAFCGLCSPHKTKQGVFTDVPQHWLLRPHLALAVSLAMSVLWTVSLTAIIVRCQRHQHASPFQPGQPDQPDQPVSLPSSPQQKLQPEPHLQRQQLNSLMVQPHPHQLEIDVTHQQGFSSIERLQRGRELGRGAFGVVYAATFKGADVAVKVVGVGNGARAKTELARKLQTEINLWCNVRHPHVCTFFHAEVVNNELLIVLELLQVCTKEVHTRTRRFPQESAHTQSHRPSPPHPTPPFIPTYAHHRVGRCTSIFR